jgi:hypothetical protein
MRAIISSATLSVALGPGIDDLVVLLALGDQAIIVLLLEFLDLARVSSTSFLLGVGDDHVVLAERNAGRQAWRKPSP